jgi:glycosyltransferase involved in cell wall biosynthesis
MDYELPLSPAATELTEWVHLPTPGDHYSPATGSAVISVIAGLAEAQATLGEGIPRILVTRGTQNGYPPYPSGKVVESSARCRYPTLFERVTDLVLGRVTGLKPFTHRLYKKLAQSLPRNFSGVLIVHNQPGAILPLRRRFPRARLVLHLHNASFGPYSDSEISKITKSLSALVCCSNFLAKQTQQRIPRAHALKVTALLNGVDTEQFRPPLKRPETGQFPLTVLFVGRMLPEKGPDLLLKAAAILHQKQKQGNLPAFRLRLVGSSNFNASAPLTRYERSLRHLAFPLGKTVEFRPFVKRDKVPRLYQEADIFVAPSNWDEPFGLTIAEAMASGLPCVVSKRGGIPELAGDAALYFSPPQVERLADQIEQLLTQPALRAELGRRARERTLELDWNSRFEQLRNAVFSSQETAESAGSLAV